MAFVALAIVLALAHTSNGLEPHPTIYVTEGQIKGKIQVSRNERKYVSFLGIPYANVPARFEATKTPESWEGVRDCTYYGDVCPQSDENGELIGSEDCLYLNVFMPTFEKPTKNLLPVMVFLSDENFQSTGHVEKYGAEYLMDEDLILVTLSYRLGALGFLTTEDPTSPGNLGLKDQSMALKWIQGNIHIFGGDRMRVTIFGSGTGSVAASLHLVSPHSKDLFAGVISQSGSFSCPNAIIYNPREIAFGMGSNLGCQQNTSVGLLTCLKSKNVSDIIAAQANITGWFKGKLVTPFGPSVELLWANDTQGLPYKFADELFLPDYPENLIKMARLRKVPWVVGVNSKAGYSKDVSILKHNSSYLSYLSQNWNNLAPLLFEFSTTAQSPPAAAMKIREFYFFNQNISTEYLGELYNAISDHKVFHCVKNSAKIYGKYAPVYPYYFTYQRVNYMRLPEVNGVSNMEELQYLFSVKTHQGVERQIISKRSRSFPFSMNLVKLWTSFAEQGNPANTWPTKNEWRPLSDAQCSGRSPIKWYRLDDDCCYVSEPFFPRMKFWEEQETDWKLRLSQNETWQRRKEAEEQFHIIHERNVGSSFRMSLFIFPLVVVFITWT